MSILSRRDFLKISAGALAAAGAASVKAPPLVTY